MPAPESAVTEETDTPVEISAPAPKKVKIAPKPKVKIHKPEKKAAPKPAKKVGKPAAKPTPKKADDGHMWTPKRVNLVKVLRVLKAVTATSARTAADIAAKAKVDPMVVKDIFYKDAWLCAAGYSGVTVNSDGAGLAYYLTAKGAKVELPKV